MRSSTNASTPSSTSNFPSTLPCQKKIWAAANGGVTNGGLRGVWPPFLEIGRNQPFSPFFCLFRPFQEGAKSTWEIQKTEEKGLFPQISSDLLNPHLLNPHLRHSKKWLLENRPCLRERSWIFSSETATAFLSFSEQDSGSPMRPERHLNAARDAFFGRSSAA